MTEELRIAPVGGGGQSAEQWRHVHNTIIPTHQLTADEVRERAGRHHLAVAYAGDPEAVVGCSTVRPPADDTRTATVIARILPGYRGRGFGDRLYAYALADARALGAEVIETVVLASNEDGLRFAVRHGFAEFERYVLPGDTIPYVTLRLGS